MTFISLKTPGWSSLPSVVVLRSGAQFSFGAWLRSVSVGAVPASQFRRGPSGGQMKVGACRDRIGAALRAARLERLVARENVPCRDQDLARDRALGRVALAGALLDIDIQAV